MEKNQNILTLKVRVHGKLPVTLVKNIQDSVFEIDQLSQGQWGQTSTLLIQISHQRIILPEKTPLPNLIPGDAILFLDRKGRRIIRTVLGVAALRNMVKIARIDENNNATAGLTAEVKMEDVLILFREGKRIWAK